MAKSSFVERNKAVREAWNKELELVQKYKNQLELYKQESGRWSSKRRFLKKGELMMKMARLLKGSI